MVELSEAALSICRESYNGGRGCGKCPIQRQCSAPHACGQEGLNTWRDKINQAVEVINTAPHDD